MIRVARRLIKFFQNRAGLAAVCGGVVALMAQTAFTTTFSDLKGVMMERMTFPMFIQRMELTRKIIAHVPCDERILAFQPIIAEAFADNLRVVHEKQANALLYSDLFSTDKWNDVALITMPCELP